MSYAARIQALLTPAEKRFFERLETPQKVQTYLDSLPINFEMRGETYMSPRRTIVAKTAHCFEGALVAAAAFAYHGQRPLILDFQTLPHDEDHVVAPFKQGGYWGAVSKTNHAVLRYRDPVYASVRELAMSYFHEYLLWTGKKSLLAYSRPFDLRRYSPETWLVAQEDLVWLVEAIDDSRHFPAVPRKNAKHVRKASGVELRAMKLVEWKPPRGFKSNTA